MPLIITANVGTSDETVLSIDDDGLNKLAETIALHLIAYRQKLNAPQIPGANK